MKLFGRTLNRNSARKEKLMSPSITLLHTFVIVRLTGIYDSELDFLLKTSAADKLELDKLVSCSRRRCVVVLILSNFSVHTYHVCCYIFSEE